MIPLVQSVVDMLTLASLYAMAALGIALIFGVMRLINFAHGELIMLGGYTMWVTSSWPWPAMVASAMAVTVAAALLMERLAFRPVRGAPASTLLITSFTLSYLLQNSVTLSATSTAKGVTLPALVTQAVNLGDIRVPFLSVATVVVGAATLSLLALFLKNASLGIQMRAAAEDFTMARLLGVRADLVIAAAFAISGALGGLVALAVVSQTGVITPTMGLSVTLIAFVATVIGGIGSIAGAALGGAVLGVLTVVLQLVLPSDLAPYRDAFLFGAVILIVLFRPQGLLAAHSLRESL